MRSSRPYVILNVVVHHWLTGNWLDYCPRNHRLQGGSRQTSSRIAVTRTVRRSFNLRRIPILFAATSQRALRHSTVTSVKRGIVFLWNTTCGCLVKLTSIYRRNVEKISSSLSSAIIVIIMYRVFLYEDKFVSNISKDDSEWVRKDILDN